MTPENGRLCRLPTDGRIAYEASSEIRDVISTIGRTEDITLSPDNTRLAVLDYLDSRIFLFSLRIDRTNTIPRITISDYSVISSVSLRQPHGVAFLGNDHIIVANRASDVVVLRIPPTGQDSHERTVMPLKTISGQGMLRARVKSPGSVACYEVADNCYRVLVCNNHWHFVTSHIIHVGNSIRVRHQGVLIERALKIPDGIALSADHAWIAISNHVSGELLIYRNTPDLNRQTPPAAVLRGLVCPHGVRFTPGGERLLVADAASQYMHVYERADGEWGGRQEPSTSIRLLDDDSFYLGRCDAREGGIKGIDIDRSNTVLVTTRLHDVVAFYDLTRLLARPSTADSDEIATLCEERDQSLQFQRGDVLNRQWTLEARARHVAWAPRRWSARLKRRAGLKKRLWRLYLRNRWSRETLLDPSGPALSLTTHGHRLELVFYTIESIGLGSRKPSRITLWIQEREAFSNPPVTLRRLRARGLEIGLSEAFGPHTKYYPYIRREDEFETPLVTADDDVLYPTDWLERLIEAYEANPSGIHCYQARRISMKNNRFMPYREWRLCSSTSPSHLNFILGVSGVMYPPDFLQYLKRLGSSFERCCPNSDDIWLTVNALRAGFKIAQVRDVSGWFTTIPGSQIGKPLWHGNVLAGGNQMQLIQTFSERDLAALQAHLLSEGEASGSLGVRGTGPDA